MNILFQAYACLPDKGGEFAVSWGWLNRLDSMLNEDDCIYVISLTLEERHITNSSLKHVKLIHIEQLEKIKWMRGAYYLGWQWLAYKTVKKMDVSFDIIHQYSLSDFRMPGFFYKIKGAYKIFGPVGGGQQCPKNLMDYDDKSHILRDIMNFSCKINPFYKHKISKYDKVYACNYETQKYIKGAEVLIDCPLNDRMRKLVIPERNHEKVVIVFCGRLINKKGLFLLLDVIERLRKQSHVFELQIYGDGEQKDRLLQEIKNRRLEECVMYKGYMAYEQIVQVYNQADIFVLPSLRESGGNVLIEAMATALPIVSLDMSMSHILKQHQAGLFVNVNQSKEEILGEYTEHLGRLIDDEGLRKQLGLNGYQFVNSNLTWDALVEKIYGSLLKDNIEKRENS